MSASFRVCPRLCTAIIQKRRRAFDGMPIPDCGLSRSRKVCTKLPRGAVSDAIIPSAQFHPNPRKEA